MFDEYKFLQRTGDEKENPLAQAGIHPVAVTGDSPEVTYELASRLLRDRAQASHPDVVGDNPLSREQFNRASDLLSIFRSPEAVSDHMTRFRAQYASFGNRIDDLTDTLTHVEAGHRSLGRPFAEMLTAPAYTDEVSLWAPRQLGITLLPIDVRSRITGNPSEGQLKALKKAAAKKGASLEDLSKDERAALYQEIMAEILTSNRHTNVNLRTDQRMRTEHGVLYKKYEKAEGATGRMSKADRNRYEQLSESAYNEEFQREFPESEIERLMLERYERGKEFERGSKKDSGPPVVDTYEFYIQTVMAAQKHARMGTIENGKLTLGDRVVDIVGIVSCASEVLPKGQNAKKSSGLSEWHEIPASGLNRILHVLTDQIDPILIDYDGWDEAAERSHYLVTASRTSDGRKIINIEGEIQAIHTSPRTGKSA